MKSNYKKLSSIVGTLTGLLSVIFSFVVKGLEVGSYEMSLQYGGDAYTGIQNAAAQAANNALHAGEIIRFGFFAVLLIAGLALICHYGPSLLEEVEANKETNKVVNTEANTVVGKEADTEAGKETKVEAVVDSDQKTEKAAEPKELPEEKVVHFAE